MVRITKGVLEKKTVDFLMGIVNNDFVTYTKLAKYDLNVNGTIRRIARKVYK